jgi:hypothetical protein
MGVQSNGITNSGGMIIDCQRVEEDDKFPFENSEPI